MRAATAVLSYLLIKMAQTPIEYTVVSDLKKFEDIPMEKIKEMGDPKLIEHIIRSEGDGDQVVKMAKARNTEEHILGLLRQIKASGKRLTCEGFMKALSEGVAELVEAEMTELPDGQQGAYLLNLEMGRDTEAGKMLMAMFEEYQIRPALNKLDRSNYGRFLSVRRHESLVDILSVGMNEILKKYDRKKYCKSFTKVVFRVAGEAVLYPEKIIRIARKCFPDKRHFDKEFAPKILQVLEIVSTAPRHDTANDETFALAP